MKRGRVNKVNKVVEEGLRMETKTILVIVTLILAYPIGLVLMFWWMKWPVWIKLILSIPAISVVLLLGTMIFLLYFRT